MTVPSQEAGAAGTARAGALFSGSFSAAADLRLKSLGTYLLVVGLSCQLCAVAVNGLVKGTTFYSSQCGQDVGCYRNGTGDGSVALCVTSNLFVVAGPLAVAASRRRNRCLLLTSVVFSSLAAMGAVAVIAVGGASILPGVWDCLFDAKPATPDVSVHDSAYSYNSCSTSVAWARYREALAVWEKNMLITKLALAFTVVMIQLAMLCLALSLVNLVHVCRSVFSTAYCKTLCPGCWTWCFDQLEDGSSAVPLTAPATQHTDCDKHPLAAAMVTQESVIA